LDQSKKYSLRNALAAVKNTFLQFMTTTWCKEQTASTIKLIWKIPISTIKEKYMEWHPVKSQFTIQEEKKELHLPLTVQPAAELIYAQVQPNIFESEYDDKDILILTINLSWLRIMGLFNFFYFCYITT